MKPARAIGLTAETESSANDAENTRGENRSTPPENALDEEAPDFITRHVLEQDIGLFDG